MDKQSAQVAGNLILPSSYSLGGSILILLSWYYQASNILIYECMHKT